MFVAKVVGQSTEPGIPARTGHVINVATQVGAVTR
jgi:hypothetical protein